MTIKSPADRAISSASPGQAAPSRTVPAAPADPVPSVHVRAVITWLAIFPLVAVGMMVLNPFVESWHPVLRTLLLTALVVPVAVYFVVPRLFAAYGKLMKRRAVRASAAKR